VGEVGERGGAEVIVGERGRGDYGRVEGGGEGR